VNQTAELTANQT